MGQMADDILTGACCAICCQYFEDAKDPDKVFEHGAPVVCKECFSTLGTPEERKAYQEATADTIGTPKPHNKGYRNRYQE